MVSVANFAKNKATLLGRLDHQCDIVRIHLKEETVIEELLRLCLSVCISVVDCLIILCIYR